MATVINVKATQNSLGNLEVVFTSKYSDKESVDCMDTILEALASKRSRRAGYLNANTFVIEVKAEEAQD